MNQKRGNHSKNRRKVRPDPKSATPGGRSAQRGLCGALKGGCCPLPSGSLAHNIWGGGPLSHPNSHCREAAAQACSAHH